MLDIGYRGLNGQDYIIKVIIIDHEVLCFLSMFKNRQNWVVK